MFLELIENSRAEARQQWRLAGGRRERSLAACWKQRRQPVLWQSRLGNRRQRNRAPAVKRRELGLLREQRGRLQLCITVPSRFRWIVDVRQRREHLPVLCL